jgi:type 1 glutamine amidotransferase
MNSNIRSSPRPIGIATLIAILLLVVDGSYSQSQAQDAPTKKIVFLAGPKEHGAPGRHEYEKDLREIAWSLEHASNLKNIKTVVLVGKAPRDLSVLRDASAIVIDGSGGWLKTETGILFPQDQDTDGRSYDPETTAWLKDLDQLVKEKHIGLAILHYSMWVDNWAGKHYLLNWFGGLWLPYSSHNPVDTWTVKPLPVQHQILYGIKPWTYREEMYSRYFLFHDPRRTELLEATPSNMANGGPDPVSWAYDRPDGGRSFVWGGSDFHDNMHAVSDYRRFLLNGVAWIAGLDVPAGGVSAPPPPEF